MKTYVRYNEKKDEFIKRVRPLSGNNKFLKVRYASGGGIFGAINGMRNYKIEATEDRIENINFYMEREALKGKEKLSSYKNLGGICTVLSAVSTGFTMAAPTAFESIAAAVQSQANLEDAAAAAVVVGATSAIATGIASFVNIRKVFEINKLNYRDENRVILDQVKQYPSAMYCISKKKKTLIQKRQNPFGVIWAEDYRKRDLKKIVTRIKQGLILELVSNGEMDFPIEEEHFACLQASNPDYHQPIPIYQPQSQASPSAPVPMTPEQISQYLAAQGIVVSTSGQPSGVPFFQDLDNNPDNQPAKQKTL